MVLMKRKFQNSWWKIFWWRFYRFRATTYIKSFFSKRFLLFVYRWKRIRRERFSRKNERDSFVEAFLGEATVSFAPEDIYSYCSCKEKVKEISEFLNKINIKDYFKKIGTIEEFSSENFKGEKFTYLGVKLEENFLLWKKKNIFLILKI